MKKPAAINTLRKARCTTFLSLNSRPNYSIFFCRASAATDLMEEALPSRSPNAKGFRNRRPHNSRRSVSVRPASAQVSAQ